MSDSSSLGPRDSPPWKDLIKSWGCEMDFLVQLCVCVGGEVLLDKTCYLFQPVEILSHRD